jgi:hypothetical protein
MVSLIISLDAIRIADTSTLVSSRWICIEGSDPRDSSTRTPDVSLFDIAINLDSNGRGGGGAAVHFSR